MISLSRHQKVEIVACDVRLTRAFHVLKPPAALSCRRELTGTFQSYKRKSVPISTIYFAKDLMSGGAGAGEGPDFQYTHLWTSQDGETHIQECRMTGFDLKKYAQAEQYVKDGGEPTKTVFTVRVLSFTGSAFFWVM
jgi:hypothetical protein